MIPAIRPVDPAEFLDVRRVLERSNDTPYDLARVADEKVFGEGLAGRPKAIGGYADGRLIGIAVTCGRHLRLLAVDREHRKRGVGSALLSEAESEIAAEGSDAINVAAEPGNYFVPGVFENDCATLGFFDRRGYQRRADEPLNLAAALSPSLSSNSHEQIRRATRADRERIVRFVAEEFGAEWAFETLRGFDQTQPTVFIAQLGEVLAGFVAFEANNRGLGTFGPLGIRKEMRRQSFGEKLVVAALAAMREAGYSQAIIPWTAAVDFYRQTCGAVVAHRFIRYEKPL